MTDMHVVAFDLSIIPIEAEADNLESIAIASDLRSKVRNNLLAQEGLTVTSLPTTTRSGDLIEVVRTVVEGVYDHRTELIALLGIAIPAITALGGQRRIGEIVVEAGNKTITIKDADIDRAEQLLREALPAEAIKQTIQKPRVTVRTSKRRSK